MTEHLKKFAEFLSAQGKEAWMEISNMEKDELIAYAVEMGFPLTEEDFELPEEDEALSLDELKAAAGGDQCTCPVGGGGYEKLIKNDDGTESGDGGCACVLGGGGRIFDHDEGDMRCLCIAFGYGNSYFNED